VKARRSQGKIFQMTRKKLAAIVAAIAGVAMLSACGSKSGSSDAVPGTPAVTTPAVSSPAPAAATPPPAPTPTIVARYSGDGEENTPPFTVPDDWHLSWWYSCSSFGSAGNFIVSEYDTDGSQDFSGADVDELGTGEGPVATYVYGDAGEHYLQINSECDWQVVVVTG
jgi:hypothetical protein